MSKKTTAVSFVHLFAVSLGLGAIAAVNAPASTSAAARCCDTCVCCKCPDGRDCGEGCGCDLCECC